MIKDKSKQGKNSIFNSIILSFKRLFDSVRKNKFSPVLQNKNDSTIDTNSGIKPNFFESLKVENYNFEADKECKMEIFIKNLEENPDIVENLSDDRLDKLISFYEKMTKEKEAKIKSLKTQC